MLALVFWLRQTNPIGSYMSEQRTDQSERVFAQAVHHIERQEYESMLPWLLQSNPGEWIAINRHDLIGIYPTYGDAIREGYAYTQSQDKDIKDAPFVIQILEQQPERF